MEVTENACQHCKNRKCFGYALLLIPEEIIPDASFKLRDSCGLLTGEQFVGQVIGNYLDIQGPVSIVQRSHPDCNIINSKYQRFEWANEESTFGSHYKPVCKIIQNNTVEDCNKCKGINERVYEIIFGANYSDDPKERLEELRRRCKNDDANKNENEKLNIIVKTTEEPEKPGRPDIQERIFLKYKCPITGFTEIAIPFVFNKGNKLVLFFGQHLMKEDKAEISGKLDRFFSDSDKIKEVISNEEYREAKEDYKDVSKQIKRGQPLIDEVDEEELRNRIIMLFECVRNVKILMDDLLIAKTHRQMDLALVEAHETFKKEYFATPIGEASYYTDAMTQLENLRKSAIKAMQKFSDMFEINITLFLPSAVRIQEKDRITLKPLQALCVLPKEGEALYKDIIISGGKIIQLDNRVSQRIEDEVNFWIYPYQHENKAELISAGFPIAFVVDFRNAPEPWRKRDGRLHEEIREAFGGILSAFAQHVRAEGAEVQAAFDAVRIQHFSAVLRHEIGQKTAMMQNRYEQYLQYLNDYYRKNITDIRSSDWAWDSGRIDPFKQKLRTFINNTMTHVYTVSVMSNEGRYLKGIPEPLKTHFMPYGKILFKWGDMFEKSCNDSYLHCPFPGAEKLADSDKRWTDYPKMYADEGQIEQVAYNMTTNAIKYSHRYTSFKLDCKKSRDSKWYELIVVNYSSPISKDEQDEIFKYGKYRKQQGSSVYLGREIKEVSGLGLFISRKIAEAHRGTLTLDESASEALCEYNIPLLLLIDVLPDDWRPNESSATGVGKGMDNAKKLEAAKEELLKLKDLRQIVHPDILSVTDGQLSLDNLIEKWAKTQEKVETLELSKQKWLATFYDELRLPTAKIVFTMRIPL